MARKSTDTDKKLLRTGIALARKKGLGALSVRELCAKAGVNLGMFHYHFGSKENFDAAVLRQIYKDILGALPSSLDASKTPKENIRTILLEMLYFSKENKVLLSALFGDVLTGNKKILEFISNNFTLHISLLNKEINRARARGAAAKFDAASIMVMVAAHVVVPQIFEGTMLRYGGAVLKKFDIKKKKALLEKHEVARIDFILDSVLG